MSGIKQRLLKLIDPIEFWHKEFPEWDGQNNSKVSCPRKDKHKNGDRNPSLSIGHTGQFKCFSCGLHGTSIIGYYTDVYADGDFKRACAELATTYRADRDNSILQKVRECHNYLRHNPKLLSAILQKRGWNIGTIQFANLGWSKQRRRVCIPIFTSEGLLCDLRWHDSLNLEKSNRVPVIGENGSINGLPYVVDWGNFHRASQCFILEGEPDTILAHQLGLPAITFTGGASVIAALPYDKLKLFADKDIIVFLDADKAGREAALQICQRLTAISVRSIKRIEVPIGKDLTDFIVKHAGSIETIYSLVSKAPYLLKSAKKDATNVHLSKTGEAQYTGTWIHTEVLVSGKRASPFVVPEKLSLQCRVTDRYCRDCPCKEVGKSEYVVLKEDAGILDWLYSKDYAKLIKDLNGLPKKCDLIAEVTHWQNIEELTIIPALSDRRSINKNQYVTRRAFYLGHGIEANNSYVMNAMPVSHPWNSESCLIVDDVTGAKDAITKFELTEEMHGQIKSLFAKPAKEILKGIAKQHARNVTRIYGRSEVHMAVDLAFHSPLNFIFDGYTLPKGAMELLLLGDTRTGKGTIVEGLIGYYDLGEIVSGENASYMGLVGGAQKVQDHFQLSWGIIPINHGRLVGIDEFSGLDEDILGRLSRIRSEGIAEINKGGIHSKTPACARLIWIANPRKGRAIDEFTYGVEAIHDLVKTQEDIARFDLAIILSKNEVEPAKMNKLTQSIEVVYPQEVLRSLLLWVWSRQTDEILFNEDATKAILEISLVLSRKYSSKIPLIQAENVRYKLAKLAAAIACRVFSTEDGKTVKVTLEHVELAKAFIYKVYDKPTCGYAQYSDNQNKTADLKNVSEMDAIFRVAPELIVGLLEIDRFGVRELQDWLAVDAGIAKKQLSILVRANAIQQESGGIYVKRPAFIRYLTALKRKHDNAK